MDVTQQTAKESGGNGDHRVKEFYVQPALPTFEGDV
jgi:hypothetical protein